MKLLSIECSSREISVAAIHGERTARTDSAGFSGNAGSGDRKGTSALLVPMIQSVLEEVSVAPGDVELIGVTKGPGSFTGLRVGVVTARTMAYVSGAKLVGVNTLEAVAIKTAEVSNIETGATLNVVVNAQRGQLFGGRYRAVDDGVEAVGDMQLFDREQWLESIEDGEIVSGPGLKPVLQALEESTGAVIAPESCREPDVLFVAKIAGRDRVGSNDAVWNLEPVYFRPSYADEKVSD
ncbi:MAG: tRNA (adenosine(37)-N6)-threonylcarbamoyltransferase complex dimerization subunit type 1 TsaB [Planctomycetota bacterium]